VSTLAQFARSSQQGLTHAATTLAAWGRHDFCPWANPYVSWLKQPLGWFVLGAVASALVGACVAPQAWLLCTVLVVVAAMGVFWPLFALRGVSATLAFDRSRCHEGESVEVTLEVTNRWPWPVWGLSVEHAEPTPRPVDDRTRDDLPLVALERVPGRSLSRFTLTWQPSRRGLYPEFAPRLSTGFPFGLWSATRPLPLRAPIIVRPRTIGLANLPCACGPSTAAGALVDRAGDDGGLLGARLYRPGDSLRRVHWVHTARRDTLLVCERQTTASRSVLIELDVPAFARCDDDTMGDWACRIVASMSREFVAHGCEIAVLANGERFAFSGTTRGWGELLDRLAVQTFASHEIAVVSSSPSRRAVRRMTAPTQGGAPPLWIVVTTYDAYQARMDAGRRLRSRSSAPCRYVVFTADAHRDGASAETKDADGDAPWMAIGRAGDIERQFQQQWERACHDDWART